MLLTQTRLTAKTVTGYTNQVIEVGETLYYALGTSPIVKWVDNRFKTEISWGFDIAYLDSLPAPIRVY